MSLIGYDLDGRIVVGVTTGNALPIFTRINSHAYVKQTHYMAPAVYGDIYPQALITRHAGRPLEGV